MRRLETVPTLISIEESIEKDAAQRNDEVVWFIEMLDRIEGPYCIAIDAPWGDGKTFFVRTVEHILKAKNPNIEEVAESESLKPVMTKLEGVDCPYLPFYFNAWENDFADDPITALFACMASEFQRSEATKIKSTGEAATKIVDVMLSVTPLGLRISDAAKALAGRDLVAAYGERLEMRGRIDDLASKGIIEVANKLVIFIDELDRCRPDFSVRLLEQVKALFQSEKIIVVLSMDSAQLANAVGGMYGPGFDTQHFLERFFDQKVTLTHHDPYEFLKGAHYSNTTHNYDIVVQGLLNRTNPTIRDAMHLVEKIDAGRRYCDLVSGVSRINSFVRCAVIPLLIFLDRADPQAFREVTGGADYDALYQYGRRCEAFISVLDRYLERCARRFDSDAEGAPPTSEDRRRDFMRAVCTVLYSQNKGTTEVYQALEKIGGDTLLNPAGLAVCKTLRFPKECYEM